MLLRWGLLSTGLQMMMWTAGGRLGLAAQRTSAGDGVFSEGR